MATISRTYGATTANPVASGSTILANHINTDLDTIYSEFNGNISNDNISASAAIVTSKLSLGSGSATNIVMNNNIPIKFKNAGGTADAQVSEDTSSYFSILGDTAVASLRQTAFTGSSGRDARIYVNDASNVKSISLTHNGTDGYILSSSGNIAFTSAGTVVMPGTSNSTYLGFTANRWKTYYGVNADDISSDQRMKSDIVDCDHGLDFILNLKPKSYVKDGSHYREYGFIAQDIEKLTDDFVSYDEQNDRYGLRYTELIAPIVKAIQEQQAQIEALKSE